jgi:hypothetical protein
VGYEYSVGNQHRMGYEYGVGNFGRG